MGLVSRSTDLASKLLQTLTPSSGSGSGHPLSKVEQFDLSRLTDAHQSLPISGVPPYILGVGDEKNGSLQRADLPPEGGRALARALARPCSARRTHV